MNFRGRMCETKIIFVCILSHNVVLHSGCSFSLRCNPLFEIWIYKSLSIRENLTSCKKKKTLTSWVQHDKTLQETIAYPDKRKSLLVIQIQGTLGNKLNGLKPLVARRALRFRRS